jgi:hypothetical protein
MIVDITNEVALRALGYVAAVSRRGHRLTVGEFEAYINNPAQRTKRSAHYESPVRGLSGQEGDS